MIRSLSEFRFFKSFRLPVESSDDIHFTVELDDSVSDHGDYLDDIVITDVSVTGIGFRTKARISQGDSLTISIAYKRLRFDVEASVVRSISNNIEASELNYGAEIGDEEDREKMARFLGQLINHFNQERLRDCIRELALAPAYSDLTEGFEMFSLMLSLYKDIIEFADKEGFIQSMLEEVARILNAQRAVIYLINTETNELEADCSVGIEKKHLRFDYRKGVAGAVFTTGSSLNIDASNEKIAFFDRIDKKTGTKTRSVICSPISNRQDKVIGVIQVSNKRNEPRFTEDDEKTMKLLALVFSAFYSQYNPMSKKSLIRRFSAPHARDIIYIGKSDSTTELRKSIMKLKDQQSPLLITGERGVGKELFARILHSEGSRGLNDFEVFDCRVRESDELEIELFGEGDKLGALMQCSGGSVCLKEFTYLSKPLQRKLAHVLREGTLTPDSEEKITTRVFFTSKDDISQHLDQGTFDPGFYEAFNHYNAHIAPLRERKRDIVELLDYYLAKECKRQGFLQKVFSDELKENLLDYDWPGNVNELITAVNRIVKYNPKNHVITEVDGQTLPILEQPLKPQISSDIPYVNDFSLDLKDRVALVERVLINTEIKRSKGNKSRAAKEMGISREALRKKLIASDKVLEKIKVREQNKKEMRDVEQLEKFREEKKAA